MESKELQFFRDMLQGMLDDAINKSQETIEEMHEAVEIYADPADRATAESDRAFVLRLRDRERKLVIKIQQAMQRIEDGEYGICSECGEDISIDRLKARPMTTLCIVCKSKQEKDEQVRGD